LTPVRAERQQAIELARLVAAFCIVAYHTKVPGTTLYYAGLIFFLFLSPYLECGPNWSRRRPVRDLAKLFLVPWAFWMLVYGALNVLARKPMLPGGFNIAGILAGSSLHLWFMPAMFAVLVVFNETKRVVSAKGMFWSTLIAGALMLASTPVTANSILLVSAPFAQWMHAAPAVLLGAAFGLRTLVLGGSAAWLVATCAALASAAFSGRPEISVTYPLGIGASAVVIAHGSRFMPPRLNVQGLARCSLGIFLCHIVFVRGFNALVGREILLTAVCAFACATAATYLARRYLPRTQLILG
jgi:hypothetical protein